MADLEIYDQPQSLTATGLVKIWGCNDTILVDCRPFIAYNEGHIRTSHNINCPPIVKRRSGGSLPLANVITCANSREKLLAGDYKNVVIYDQNTDDFQNATKDSNLYLVVKSLQEDARLRNNVFYLTGGYDAFTCQYPQACVKPSSPSSGSTLDSPRSCGKEFRLTDEFFRGEAVEILPWLYLGSSVHASQKSKLRAAGITALLNVSNSCQNHFPESFLYKTIPVADDSFSEIGKWFQDAINFIDSVRSASGKVLVHCHAGVSRSATICIAYVMQFKKCSLDEAYNHVKTRRNVIAPNLNFMSQLEEFNKQIVCSYPGLPSSTVSPLGFLNSSCANHMPKFDFSFGDVGSPVSPVLTPDGHAHFFGTFQPLMSPS
ncbi:dual specificity protein phosphatase 2 isoform X1 [Lingula anatina]|uniref:Dual specificity protein phosphatase 2 isoform X1 n=1 Tax=Lingula anatina TaxID=7574 RepID=A0A1S3KDH5_LINAN|nr:dual specificity protein phosphatase 2 isoform X1 [Lingula anatina]|eukprot:XP_013420509.1 dual specificity protein phosphatase 2 isoform X1 [Lingula anatina]